MARDRLNSDYPQVINDVTSCSCMGAPIQKQHHRSLSRSSMFQEPFFLHPPGSRPRDGLYINPMSSSFSPVPRPHKELPPSVGVVVGVTNTNTLTNVPHHPSNGSNGSNGSNISRGSNGSNASSNGSESFYLHSPHELVYTRIAHLFERETELIVHQPIQPPMSTATMAKSPLRASSSSTSSTSSSRSSGVERRDDTLMVKVDVHIGNGTLKQQHQQQNGSSTSPRLEQLKDNVSEHAYEQIGPKQTQTQCREGGSPSNGSPKLAQGHVKVTTDNTTDASRSQKTDRRYSRSSSASESSHLSSEVHCCSSTASTPSLSRNSSNERTSRSPRIPETLIERRNSPPQSTRTESERDANAVINGPSFRPPPPPPPPPPEIEEVVVVTAKVVESIIEEERIDGTQTTTQQQKCEATIATVSGIATGGSEAPVVSGTIPSSSHGISCRSDEQRTTLVESSCSAEDRLHQQQVRGAAAGASGGTSAHATVAAAHLVNKHMVLPFIPPKFVGHDSDTLLKPSEYLRSICNANGGVNGAPCGSLSKARSVDNLDIQGRGEEEAPETDHQESGGAKAEVDDDRSNGTSGPPPPPLPPPAPSSAALNGLASTSGASSVEADSSSAKQNQQQHSQPLATISIQDLTSVQLRRTNVKMHATKTFSAPPNRSVSMTNVSEAFFVQKTDLIAELKKTKDIPGIKKMKVQQAQVEKSQEQNLISEINKAFNISTFVEQIPEKDSSGNVIPIWKRQMLARKAAERAKKELEEQIARENEEKRQKAIPPWKRQLLAKKDSLSDTVKNTGSSPAAPAAPASIPAAKVEPPVANCKKELQVDVPLAPIPTTLMPTTPPQPTEEMRPAVVQMNEKKSNDVEDDTDNVHIIPWRAQLRKTNSKLNILD